MKKMLVSVLAFATLGALPALAADMAPRYTKAPAMAVPVNDWTGFYVGLNAGGAWGREDHTTGFSPFDLDANARTGGNAAAIQAQLSGRSDLGSSFTGGFQAGYNWQSAQNWVLGIEGDINYVDLGRNTGLVQIVTLPVGVLSSQTTRLDWLSTIRGRLGYSFGSLMIYGTGGLAIAHEDSMNYTQAPLGGGLIAPEVGHVSDTRLGYTVGGGVEYALTRNWSVKGEYLYTDLGTINYVSSSQPLNVTAFHTASSAVKFNIARAGLNYKF
jgi:outer membrane immunogenic protein